MTTLCDAALDVLRTPCAKTKATKTRAYAREWRTGTITEIGRAALPDRPTRPEHPLLMCASEMPKRGRGSTKNKTALLHALAHIELNAIDLAWDVMARDFDLGDFILPKAFYDDWMKVADDEAKHHLMLEERLNDLGATYGDHPAHDGLWESSEKTAHDFAARLGIVPMVLEARGLDVTPGMIVSMEQQGDHKTADMLRIILEDEVTHVRAGTVWFEAWCAHKGLNAEAHWQDLVRKYFGAALKRPFNHPDREEAGMIRDWYEPMADVSYPCKPS